MKQLLAISTTGMLALLAANYTHAATLGGITYQVQSDGSIGTQYYQGSEGNIDDSFNMYYPAWSSCHLASASPQEQGGGTLMGPLSGNFAANKTLKFEFHAPAGKRFVVNPPVGASTQFRAILSTGAYGYPYRWDGSIVSWNFINAEGKVPTSVMYSYATYAQAVGSTEMNIRLHVPESFTFTGFTVTATVPAEFNYTLSNASTYGSSLGFDAHFDMPYAPDPGQWVVLEDIVEPSNEVTVGRSIANIPGAKISLIYAPEVAEDGVLYFRTQMNGPSVNVSDNTALARWDGQEAVAILREGQLLDDAPIASFGDPLVEGQNLFFSAKLKVGAGIASTNDYVLARAGIETLDVLVREGNSAPGVDGYRYGEVIWMHPTSHGVFFSASISSSTGAPKKTGVWFHNGAAATLMAVTGGSVTINGSTHVIKSIAKPATSGASNNQTRVGNKNEIALVISTLDRVTTIKRFTAPTRELY